MCRRLNCVGVVMVKERKRDDDVREGNCDIVGVYMERVTEATATKLKE